MNSATSCCRVSGVTCSDCNGKRVIRNGHTKTGKQQYHCKLCGKRFINNYSYNACHKSLNDKIITLTKEGVGIRSSARILKISTTTLLKRILLISKTLKLPVISKCRTYEVDELITFIKRKDKSVWIVYALERISKKIVSFNIGPRTNKTLDIVLKTLRYSDARRIYTDGLRNYRYLIDQKIHKVDQYATNHIERKNLTLRTHLKRLNRRTICFSRSAIMLHACLMIYFFS